MSGEASHSGLPPLLPSIRAKRVNRRFGTRELPTFLVLAGAAILALGTIARLFLNAHLGWSCPFLEVMHLPCPSCGSTRALAALSEFRLLDAWKFNPLVVTMLAGSPLLLAVRHRLNRFARWGWPLFFGAVVVNWVYLILYLPR